jgi:[acyl-carrier-protein] S-malonyltransferase
MRAFVFPGQGSQAVGMGKALADASAHAREVFEEVDEALGQSLSRLMAEGPADELTLTENAQPAIMANAIATLRVLEREGGVRLTERCDYVAGHSLGEYSALCASGAFDLATTARLLRTRGAAMQEAVPVGEGAMAALLGCDLELARVIAGAAVDAVLAEGGAELVCTVANDNDPSQVVISGHRVAVERAVPLAKELGAKRAVLLPVSAPFHCPLMQPAAEVMENALLDADIAAPLVPVYCNVDAAPITGPGAIRVALVGQVTGMVRWRESVLCLQKEGVTEFVEFGGKVLSPMIKRIAPDATVTSLVSMSDIEAFATSV